MTPEELLKPRFKVIADYPDSIFKVGGILVEGEKDLTEAAKYPAIFKKLEWWEEREENDMPQYVKVIRDYHGSQIFKKGIIHKVIKWDVNVPYVTKRCYITCDFVLPAIKEEYEKQKQ